MKEGKIPVIDLFAGPGGLGEGFSSVLNNAGERIFDIRLSIEMEPNAHKTLELRSFFRKFPTGKVPERYYELLRKKNEKDRDKCREALFKEFPAEAQKAKNEAWRVELGNKNCPPELVDNRIIEALNGEKTWVLIGGPPCQAYSLAGRSRRQLKDNLDKKDSRVHLYKEYLRIIAKHHPAAFVMENVKGLLSSKLEGENMFELIKDDLSNPAAALFGNHSPNYRIYSFVKRPDAIIKGNPVYLDNSSFLIKAENYGIPQRRHRVIILGVREDIVVQPEILKFGDCFLTLQSVIGDLPNIRSGLNRSYTSTVTINGRKKRLYEQVVDNDTIWLNLFNQNLTKAVTCYGFHQFSEKSINLQSFFSKGAEFIPCNTPSNTNPLFAWYNDKKIKGTCNHESRSHLAQDLKRYLFASIFANVYKRFPKLEDFLIYDKGLLPDHKNANSGKFADRFRVQLPDQPASTITSHISKDGHYYIHYDPNQCRSLTVREAARIQTFPDNYLFCGRRTAQYNQVGNAVPPFLAHKIAKLLHKLLVCHMAN